MYPLDPRTIVVFIASVAALFGVALLLFWLRDRRQMSYAMWATGDLAIAAGWLLIALRNALPDFVSIVVAATCLAVGYALLLDGVQRFNRQPRRWRLSALITAAVFGEQWYWMQIGAPVEWRIACTHFLLGLMAARLVRQLRRGDDPATAHARQLTAGVFAVNAVGYLAATLVYLRLSGTMAHAFSLTEVGTALWFGTALLVVAWSIGLLFMAEQRFRGELAGLARTLEQRVTARTRELVDAQRRLQDEIEERHALAEREQATLRRYRDLYQSMHEAYAAVDMRGRITEFNDAYLRLTGYSADEITGLSFLDLTPPRWHAMEREIVAHQVMTRGYSDLFEKEYRRKDGQLVAVELRSFLLRDAAGAPRGVWALVRDVSERKRAEAALRDSEERLRLGLSAAEQGIFDLDLTTGRAKVTPEYARMLGYDAAGFEETATDWAERLHPEDREPALANFNRYLAGGIAEYSAEFRLRTADGQWKWILSVGRIVQRDEHGRPLRMLGTHTDISAIKRAEQARQLSEERLRQAVRASNTGIFDHDHLADTIHWSAEVRAMYGWDADEPHPLPDLLRMVHPDDLARVEAAIAASHDPAGDGIFAIEYRIVRADGEVRWLSKRSQTTFAGSGATRRPVRTIGAALDITERRRADDALRQSEERLRQVISVTETGIFDHDHRTDVIYWSPEQRRLHGFGPDQPVTIEAIVRSIHPEDRARVAAAIRRAHDPQGDGVYDVEYRVELPAAGIRWVSSRSQTYFEGEGPARRPVRTVGALIDITERKRSEDALREGEQRLRQAVRVAGAGIFDYDHRSGSLYWSAEQRQIYGWGADEPVGRETFFASIHPDDRAQVRAATRRAQDPAGDGMYDGEHRIVLRSGEVRWIATRSQTYFDGEGVARRPQRTIGADLDITEQQQAEEILQRMNEELEQRVAQRTSELALAKEAAESANAAKNEFLSRMSHELRTPMNAIMGFTQLLQLELREPGQRRRLDTIMTASEHLLELINDLLDLSRIESNRLQLAIGPVQLADVFKQAHALVEPMARGAGLGLSTASAAVACPVLADPTRLRQILVNLLSNAVKFNRPGGSVRVTCEALGDETIRINVTDSGRGIAAANIDRLFRPFERLDAAASGIEGTGIGLALSKRLVQLMGGRIGVHSVVGEGSTFWVDLPRAPQAAATARDLPAPASARDVKAKVLYVEDNPSNLQLIEQVFESVPRVTLIAAPSGELGLEMAVAHRPDLILLDIHLPGIDGYEVLRRLRARAETASIPVLALSADAMPVDSQRALAAGFDCYLTKPIDLAQFKDAVEQALERSRFAPVGA